MATAKKEVNVKEFCFNGDGLIPVIAQDYESGEVLMLAYMNEEAAEKTFESGYAYYYSRSMLYSASKNPLSYGFDLDNIFQIFPYIKVILW